MNLKTQWILAVLLFALCGCSSTRSNATFRPGLYKITQIAYGRSDRFVDYKKTLADHMKSTVKIDGHNLVISGPDLNDSIVYFLDTEQSNGLITLSDSINPDKAKGYGIFHKSENQIKICINDNPKESAPSQFTPRQKTDDIMLCIEYSTELPARPPNPALNPDAASASPRPL